MTHQRDRQQALSPRGRRCATLATFKVGFGSMLSKKYSTDAAKHLIPAD
jgi:hypothetical protein